jgi:hypothetical protein
MAVLIVASRKMDRTPEFDCNLTDIGFDLALEDDDVAAILTTWSAMSERRGDGFRFTRNGNGCRIVWPEFMDCYPGIFKHRASGDKRKESNGSKPEQTESNGTNGQQTRQDKTRLEKTREETPLPPLQGGGAFDPDAPDPNLSGALLHEAGYCIGALEKLTGTLRRKEKQGALEKIALVIGDLAKAGTPAPAQRVCDALTNWPKDWPRGVGIVCQRLHEHVTAQVNPPKEEAPYDPLWVKYYEDADGNQVDEHGNRV